ARHFRTAVIGDGPVHRPENSLRNVRRSRDLQEVTTRRHVAVTLRWKALVARRESPRAVHIPKKQHRRGESMYEVASTDGAQLARREEPGDRDVAERVPKGPDVMVRLAEETFPTPVAREQERTGDRREALDLEDLPKILPRRIRVAHLELDGLPDLGHIADRDRSGGALEDRADRTLRVDLIVEDEACPTRGESTRRHPAHDRKARRMFVQMIE